VIPLLEPTTCTDCPEPAIGLRPNRGREPSCENCEAERQAMIQLILGPGEEPQLDLPIAEENRYEQRQADKADRRRERAQLLRAKAAAAHRTSINILPEGGEPIKIGHHSEHRHRRMHARSDDLTRRAIADTREADRLDRLADRTEAGAGGISADDPDAVVKLEAELTKLEARREKMKARNAAARKAKAEKPHEGWQLSNLGANIRRIKGRIKELEAAAVATIPADLEIGEWTLAWDSVDNRVRVYSPRPTSPERRAKQSEAMRSRGFVWARSAGAWQRQASARAWLLAQEAANEFAGVAPVA
jgi:hypothetical protein